MVPHRELEIRDSREHRRSEPGRHRNREDETRPLKQPFKRGAYFRLPCVVLLRPTSKMSHDGSWRAACGMTINFLSLHIETHSIARGVTDPGVGSSALLDGSGARQSGVKGADSLGRSQGTRGITCASAKKRGR